MSREAVVVGSGAAGSAAAWELARRGWDVTVLERGRNLRPGLGRRPSGRLGTEYGSDEVKGYRGFGFPDAELEPYTTRTQAEASSGVARSAQGALGQLGAAVGGTSLHYNAKTPRFWKQDFSLLSDHGPIDGAQVADWPIGYDDLAPYYDLVERQVGVQGDRSAMPARTLEQSPRRRDFPMPPNPTGYAAGLLAEGARLVGMEPYPYPAAVNSEPRKGRPACNSCGMCSGFGCPINARGDALVSFLNPALRTGRVRVIERAFVDRVETTGNGRRARAVRYRDVRGEVHRVPASTVVLAGSPINTARLLLMSANRAHPTGLGNRSDQVGRNMMFHNFTIAAAFFQNLQSALQKHLKSRLSTAGATYVRFFYAWPFAIIYVWGLTRFGDLNIPAVNNQFLIYCFLGGLSQIIFTFLLIWLFSFRNFAVGTTFSKTETVQVALLGFLILGESLSSQVLVGGALVVGGGGFILIGRD